VPVATATLALALRLLPRDHRDRYRRELAAELYDVAPADRLRYSQHVLSRSWALRAALRAQPVSTIGDSTMSKPLRCRLGLHDWYVTLNPDGEKYQACARCNAERDAVIVADQSGNAAGGGFI
jgi:hypothetical protein